MKFEQLYSLIIAYGGKIVLSLIFLLIGRVVIKKIVTMTEKVFDRQNVDKDVDGVLNNLIPLCSKVIFTKPNNPKAMNPDELANRVHFFGKESYITQTLEESVILALENATFDEVTIFTGSLYLIGDVRRIITDYIENNREAS